MWPTLLASSNPIPNPIPPYPPTTTPLHIAIAFAPHRINELLQFINQKDVAGDTPLHYAAKMRAWDEMETLMKCPEWKSEEVDRKGKTAREVARQAGYKKGRLREHEHNRLQRG
jgi:hypothetical protein